MVLLKLGENLKTLVKVKANTIDGPIFNLHSKITAIMLLFASSIITMDTYFKEPIQCICGDHEKNKDFVKAIQTFCWVNSTFTLANLPPYDTEISNNETIYYSYYQWTCFILFFQGVVFYAPRWMWKHSEGGLMQHLKRPDVISSSKKKKKEDDEKPCEKLLTIDERKEKKIEISNYFMQRLKGHREYTFTYWFYEFLCLVNVTTQMCVLVRFCSPATQLNILSIISFAFPNTESMNYIFPLRTKCTFYKIGPSGDIQNHDALCILTLNYLNRLIFWVMWYWFLILIVLLTLLLFYRILIIFSSPLRYMLLKTPGKNNLKYETSFVARRLVVTDWWVLYTLKSNVDPILFKDIICELFRKLSAPKTPLLECERMAESSH